MTSEEIKDATIGYSATAYESALWLKEIAYQLAVMNERNEQDSQTEFRLPRPFERIKP